MSLDLVPSDDLTQILDAAQTMLHTHYPLERLRDGRSDDLSRLAEFGTFLLALPEDAGGAGFTIDQEAQLHVVFGRHLLSPSVLAGAIATRIALETNQPDLAEAIAAGAPVAAGVAAPAGALVFDPDQAEYALIRDARGLSLVAMASSDLTPETAMGRGGTLARLSDGADTTRASDAALHLHLLLTSAQLLGTALAARDLAVDYAKAREQFGQPIGAFQAIKHHAANMTIGTEMLSAQLDMAALALRDHSEDAMFQVAALARIAPKIALRNARLGIQIHGGMGFSAEADAHLFLKQSHILGQFLGQTEFMALSSPMAARKDHR